MQKLVYSFNEGSKDMKNLLGDKGANLAEMTKIGLRVPFGFIVTTDACKSYHADGGKLSEALKNEIAYQMEVLENVTGKRFGDRENPLLVSVRCGAPVSTPEMAETVLNLGLNDETTEGLAVLTGSPVFAYDSYRRFIQMYGHTVLGISKDLFDRCFARYSNGKPEEVVAAYQDLIMKETGKSLQQDPKEQLLEAIEAGFRFWYSDASALYHHNNNISDDSGMAVTVQAMVFGNMGETSGCGVAFSRNPLNGEKELFGEFLINAQGEDFAAGTRVPLQISGMKEYFPDVYQDFQRIAEVLEQHYKDMQEMEFTIENNKLYMLQTRTADRTGQCAVRIAVDMVKEGLISKETAVTRVDVEQIEPLIRWAFSEELHQIMDWADEIRTLKIRTNADTPADAKQALAFGAEGIGLCRTEHMFSQEERIPLIRQMIMASSEEERKAALDKLLPYQKSDFREIYEVMEDLPVTIRLLDPPLHEFLPKTAEDTLMLAQLTGIPYEKLIRRAEELEEANPMLGHRGCRLVITYPEIVEMQTRAIMEAAIEVSREKNVVIVPEIMIPLVGMDMELAEVKKTVIRVAEDCKAAYHAEIDYFIGTMIEIPRAALTAGEIAREAEFFSFGTNDLTQMVFGLSRSDTDSIIRDYVEKGIFATDPFKTIDQKGVGSLMETAVKQGKQARANLKIGICGDHGGDPESIGFCHKIGLHHVSCSPYRVPVARLAAAQAAIKNG